MASDGGTGSTGRNERRAGSQVAEPDSTGPVVGPYLANGGSPWTGQMSRSASPVAVLQPFISYRSRNKSGVMTGASTSAEAVRQQ